MFGCCCEAGEEDVVMRLYSQRPVFPAQYVVSVLLTILIVFDGTLMVELDSFCRLYFFMAILLCNCVFPSPGLKYVESHFSMSFS